MDDFMLTGRAKTRAAADEASDLMRALSNRTRMLILWELANGECTVGELERRLDLGQAYVSQQLAQLRARNLVLATRIGRQMRYRLSDPRVRPILTAILAQFRESSA